MPSDRELRGRFLFCLEKFKQQKERIAKLCKTCKGVGLIRRGCGGCLGLCPDCGGIGLAPQE